MGFSIVCDECIAFIYYANTRYSINELKHTAVSRGLVPLAHL